MRRAALGRAGRQSGLPGRAKCVSGARRVARCGRRARGTTARRPRRPRPRRPRRMRRSTARAASSSSRPRRRRAPRRVLQRVHKCSGRPADATCVPWRRHEPTSRALLPVLMLLRPGLGAWGHASVHAFALCDRQAAMVACTRACRCRVDRGSAHADSRMQAKV